jgi:hypothetical protein
MKRKKENSRAVLHGILAAVAIAGAATLVIVFRPWWTSTRSLVIAGTVLALALASFRFLFDDNLKTALRAWMARPSVGILFVIVLLTELSIAAALAFTPAPRVVRILPGPALQLQLGFPDQTLRVDVDGEVFELAGPQPRAVYAGMMAGQVRASVASELPKLRDETLAEVLRKEFDLDGDELRDHVQLWLRGEPSIMQPTGARGSTAISATPTGTLVEHGRSWPLTITPIGKPTNSGIVTYVADLP